MAQLKAEKKFTVGDELLAKARGFFYAHSASESETIQHVYRLYKEQGYLMCPHTSVGYQAMLKSIRIDKSVDVDDVVHVLLVHDDGHARCRRTDLLLLAVRVDA